MPEEPEKPTTEEITLHSAGSIPGIPGQHGPGRYIINWIERTIQRIEDTITHEPAAEPVTSIEQPVTQAIEQATEQPAEEKPAE